MHIISKVIIGLIALQHIYIVYFEMFAWTTTGRKIFGRKYSKDFFDKTLVLAANQGLYNAFLVAGLIWSLLITNAIWSKNVGVFFLSCIAVAGLYGGFTASKRILYLQGIPALIGLLSVLLL